MGKGRVEPAGRALIEMPRPEDLEGSSGMEGGMEEVLLGESPPLLDPLPRVLEGQEHVVDVDHHPRKKPWEDTEMQMEDVVPASNLVTRVDEEDVACTEFPEERLEIQLLDRTCMKFVVDAGD